MDGETKSLGVVFFQCEEVPLHKFRCNRLNSFELELTNCHIIFQVDASILLTANVPSAKKIIVHGPQGPDEGGIPSQFPIMEDVQFCQILREAVDFFGIEESQAKEFFLVDHKTSKSGIFLTPLGDT